MSLSMKSSLAGPGAPASHVALPRGEAPAFFAPAIPRTIGTAITAAAIRAAAGMMTRVFMVSSQRALAFT